MSDEEDEIPQRRGADDDDESVLLPAFINKLIKMIADPECADILQYGSDGNTILVVDSTQFAMVRASSAQLFFEFKAPPAINDFAATPCLIFFLISPLSWDMGPESSASILQA